MKLTDDYIYPAGTEVGYWDNSLFYRGIIIKYLKQEKSYIVQKIGSSEKLISENDCWLFREKNSNSKND